MPSASVTEGKSSKSNARIQQKGRACLDSTHPENWKATLKKDAGLHLLKRI